MTAISTIGGLLLAGILFASNAAAQTGNQPLFTSVQFRFVETNGIRMRVATLGDRGPLVILAHGWPESWYSWRHQMLALAEAGYRVAAPDMRGYGATDAPENVEDYNIVELAADMAGLVAWHSVLLHPDRFSALVAMSVPYSGRPAQSPLVSWQQSYGDNFYYILYHQEPGVAEAEYDANPEGLLSRLYLSPDSPRQPPVITSPLRSAGGWIGRMGAPMGLPDWLKQEDLDYFVSQFRMAGFRGGVNYYRNFHRNWELTPQLTNAHVTVPTLFIAGEKDVVIGRATQGQLQGAMNRVVDDLRDVILIPEAGHWIQQEKPEETNAAVLQFLKSL
jgi:pimeloyl-ACP methyl ester carboxylesterase